jgi:hypothetical protein
MADKTGGLSLGKMASRDELDRWLAMLKNAPGQAIGAVGDYVTEHQNSPVLKAGNWLGDVIRYGVTPDEREQMMASGKIPGMPDRNSNPAEAERYTSQYLAQRSGMLPEAANAAGNGIAFADLLSPEGADTVKDAGWAGRDAARAEQNPITGGIRSVLPPAASLWERLTD